MSRIGKQPITVPAGVKVARDGAILKVSGPQGNLEFPVRNEIGVEVAGSVINVVRKNETRSARELHGLTRTILANMVEGVSKGFEKKLETVGVGYKAEAKGSDLVLSLGFSNPVNFKLPKGITASVEKQTLITLKGADKQLVGQTAANIRAIRPPEPYKGKGVKYSNEVIRKKAGKAGKTGAAGGGK